jgi:hypothetical protein
MSEEIRRGPGRPPVRPAEFTPGVETRPASESIRPETRLDSVKEAEEYARSIIEQYGDQPDHVDSFYVNPDWAPEGWMYQKIATHIAGKENHYHVQAMMRGGWRPVMASRHPELMPKGYEGPIEQGGLMLFERPKVLNDRAQARQEAENRSVLKNAEAKLYETPANTGPRDDPGLSKLGVGVKKGYGPAIPVSAEDV